MTGISVVRSGDLAVKKSETEDPDIVFPKDCNPIPEECSTDPIEDGEGPPPKLDAPCGLFDPSSEEEIEEDDDDSVEYCPVKEPKYDPDLDPSKIDEPETAPNLNDIDDTEIVTGEQIFRSDEVEDTGWLDEIMEREAKKVKLS